MKSILQPHIVIEKRTTPTIYLDADVIIELARYENRDCKNAHFQQPQTAT